MSHSSIKGSFFVAVLAFFLAASAAAVGPLSIGDDPAVTIYRDYDDGLFGRSVYRGVVFSVKIEAFGRYRTLEVRDLDGLTAYLVSAGRAEAMASGRASGISRPGLSSSEAAGLQDGDPEKWTYAYEREGISVSFVLEKAPADFYDEIVRTYPGNPSVAETVSKSYEDGYIVRVLAAENVYRPGFARVDYEDILISAAMIGDDFQPLWGIHDGNALTSAGF